MENGRASAERNAVFVRRVRILCFPSVGENFPDGFSPRADEPGEPVWQCVGKVALAIESGRVGGSWPIRVGPSSNCSFRGAV